MLGFYPLYLRILRITAHIFKIYCYISTRPTKVWILIFGNLWKTETIDQYPLVVQTNILLVSKVHYSNKINSIWELELEPMTQYWLVGYRDMRISISRKDESSCY